MKLARSPGRDRLCLIQSGWLIRVSEGLMLNRITIKRSTCFFQSKDVEPQYVILSGLLYAWQDRHKTPVGFWPLRTGFGPLLSHTDIYAHRMTRLT